MNNKNLKAIKRFLGRLGIFDKIGYSYGSITHNLFIAILLKDLGFNVECNTNCTFWLFFVVKEGLSVV